MELGPPEMRVLGSLIEKQRTTPDAYPLTLNALRLACNQATNRDPVVDYDDATIRAAIERLSRKRWARLASGQGSRAAKYRHLVAETLGLAADELSILAVLMLRGPQTPGELKGRADRLYRFEDLAAVEATLDRLAERGHVRRLERRPGQKEDRYAQLLGGAVSDPGGEPGAGGARAGEPDEGAGVPGAGPSADDGRGVSQTGVGASEPTAFGAGAPPDDPAAREDGDPATSGPGAREDSGHSLSGPTAPADPAEARLARLEQEVADLRRALERLEAELGL